MLTNLKRRSALLITLAVVCATVSLVPQTAGAAATKVANLGTSAASDPHTAPTAPEHMKACPGDSASAAGFTDTTSTDVDCIKMFGITTGKTATTYDPTGTISRQDMARYIHRMFTATGLAAAGAVAVPAFTDTAHVAADGLAAITALASHGITTGTTATTFSPDDNVTRAQMAAFLQRFAMLVKDHGGTALLKGDPAQVGTGTFNYADITNTTFEEMESIIWLYNLGVFGTCVVDSLGQCGGTTGGTTYRPADDITRAEMATMLVNLLNHTNARPAGVTIQASSASSTLAVGAVTTLISVRGADHSPTSNVLVDEFTQLHNDAAGVAAVAPFVTTLGSCTAGVTKTLGGTLCVVDATDPSTDIRGNANGTSQTTAAYKTANWWVHKGATGSTYVDGTTSDYDKLSIGFGAAATLVNATSAVISMPDIYAKTESLAAYTGITQTDGILTYAGQSRTFTVTLKPATATDTVKSGYSIKVATTTTDVAGNATQSVAYYAATSAVGGATASWTTTCPTSGVVAPSALYATAIEHRVSMGALLDADGLPTGVSVSPMDDDFVLAPAAGAFDADATTYSMGLANGQTAGTVGLTCQDHTRAYVDNATDETLAVSSNNYAYSTAGSLASVTATAYDQYGAGVAGATVAFQRVTTNSTAAGTTTAVTLTTAANGTATLSEVHCKTGGEIKSAWSVTDPSAGANLSMSAITAADPSTATAGEGTNIYCTTAGADGDTPLAQIVDIQAQMTITIPQNATLMDSGNLDLTYGGQQCRITPDGGNDDITNTIIQTCLNALSTITSITCTGAAAAPYVVVCTFAAGTGVTTAWTCAETLADAGDGADAASVACPTSRAGVSPISFTFIDDDPTANFIVSEHTSKAVTAAGAVTTTTKYNTWLYDSTDFFTLDDGDDDIATTVTAASEAQFEAANALHNDLATHMTMTYRKTSAVTSGISLITVGT